MIVLPRHTEELHHTWQGKVLAGARDKLAAVAMSVIAHALGDAIAMKTLLEITFPGFEGIALPFFCTAGRISHTGRITAHMIDRNGRKQFNRVIFDSEEGLQRAFRGLADELKLSDAHRVALFAAVKAWIVADMRQDPVTGEKVHAA